MAKRRATNSANSAPIKKGAWKELFCKLFAETMCVATAAAGAGMDRSTVYKARKTDPDFAAAWDSAKESAIESLEAAAYERARKMSDVLLIFLLKSHKPELYRESVSLKHSGTVNLNFSELAALAAEDEQ
jgi:hypothetical protein